MNITLEQIQAAINAGYPIYVVVNGEYYELKEGDDVEQ